MSYLNCIEVKLVKSEDGSNSRTQIAAQALKGERETIKVGPRVSLKTLRKMLESTGAEVRDGVTDGCYGARTGKSFEGLTAWVSPLERPLREKDEHGDEVYNLHRAIAESGAELLEDLDGDVFAETAAQLGATVNRNNTYNYAGNNSPYFLVDADFSVIEGRGDEARYFLAIKFHCGGDIRGNYTETVVYRFEDLYELLGVVQPDLESENV